MLTREEAAAAQNIFNKNMSALLNEQVSRTVFTQIQSTGLYHTFSKLFGQVIGAMIVEVSKIQDERPYGGAEPEDLSDIIIGEAPKKSESTDEGDAK